MLVLSGGAVADSPAQPVLEAARRESQGHGYVFEQWVRETFFEGYVPEGYTQSWDIPADANQRHGRLPVSCKTAKYRSAIDLGDARRQFAIAGGHEAPRFLLVIAFWEQTTPQRKDFVNAQAVEVTAALYRRLWGDITADDLEALETVIKDRSLDLAEVRRRVRERLRQPPFTTAAMRLHPKLDHGQRRLQCSLSFPLFFRHLAPEADPGRTARPMLFGVPMPAGIASPPRSRVGNAVRPADDEPAR